MKTLKKTKYSHMWQGAVHVLRDTVTADGERGCQETKRKSRC